MNTLEENRHLIEGAKEAILNGPSNNTQNYNEGKTWDNDFTLGVENALRH